MDTSLQPSPGSAVARLSTKDIPASPSLQLLELSSYEYEAPARPRKDVAPLVVVGAPQTDTPSVVSEVLEGSVYGGLPPFFQRILATYSSNHERAIMLSGMLPVLGGVMRNVEVPYRRRLEPVSLYTLVVAPSGSDKGVMDEAKVLGQKIDDKLLAESEAARTAWRLSEGEMEEPPRRSFFVAGNSSAAALIQNVAANGGEGVMLESEAMTLTTTHGQDWGDGRDFILKASHGERYSLDRMDRRVVIESPRLNLGVAGTPKTTKEFIGTLEDGLFSRFLVYYSPKKRPFGSLSPCKDDKERRQLLDEGGALALEIYETLGTREGSLRVTLGDNEWKELEAVYGAWYEHVGHFDELNACCLRMPLHVLRMATVFTVVRAFAEGNGVPAFQERIAIEEGDLKVALTLGERCLKQAFDFARWMKETKFDSPVDPTEELVSVLPYGRFRTKDAKRIVNEKFGRSDRWVGKHLRRAVERGFLRDWGHGWWERSEDPNLTTGWPEGSPETW